MSGKPNPEGVKDLSMAFRDFAWTRERIAELKNSIAESQKTLELREAELRGHLALIKGKLDQMDVSSPGNAGWEGRYFELLLMLSEQR
jgi:hypothetical protein